MEVRWGGWTPGRVFFGSSVTAVKTPSAKTAVKIFGANLPTTVKAEDIAFGQGVTVARIVSARPDELAIDVDVAANAPIGPRDVSIAGTVNTSSLVVYGT